MPGRADAQLTEPLHPVTSFRLTAAARHAKLGVGIGSSDAQGFAKKRRGAFWGKF
jgi:hypothetical protein